MDPRIAEAADAGALEACRALFREYWASQAFAPCFQGFDRELAALPGDYAPPRGRLLLATVDGDPAGCVALRPLAPGVAEMKRLYVRPAHRGSGLGLRLARRVVDEARAIGYRTLKLDTLPSMREAQALYARLGFRDTAPYNDNRAEGVRFMSLDLDA